MKVLAKNQLLREGNMFKRFFVVAGFAAVAVALMFNADDVASADTTSPIIDIENAVDGTLFQGFDGAVNNAGDGAFLGLLSGEDQLNQLLGVSATDSETAVLADWASLPGHALPVGDSLPAVGAPGFDADLTSLAGGEFTAVGGDLSGYLSSLGSDVSGGLMGGLDLANLGGLGTDFSTAVTDLLGGLGL